MPNERILVAEDERDLRRMCQRALELAGYETVGVADGREAIAAAQREPFDVLVTDIKMPDVGGLDAFSAIRAFRPDLTSVVMTGFGTLETAMQAIRLGVYEFVLKPFRPDELTSAVERALARRRAERESARLSALIPLFDLSRVFMSSVDLEAVPKHVVRIAREALGADTASLMLIADGQVLRMHAREGQGADTDAMDGPAIGEGTAGRAVSTRQPVSVEGDLSADPWAVFAYGSAQVSSAVSVPLLTKETAVGVLSVARFGQQPPFSPLDVEFLTLLASQAAIALENARLFSEIQGAYNRLAELDELKGEFLNIAAHELRSPLAVILAYATLLEDEATGPMRDHLAQVVQGGMQLKSIIDEMVSLQHIDTGAPQLHITDVHLPTAVGEVVGDMRLLAQRRQVTIQVSIPEDLAAVRADEQLLRLILNSLVSNAVKFSRDGGIVEIRAVPDGENHIAVEVSDNGVGIPDEEIERIFERFYQVEPSLRRKHGGIGLGLAIAREMAALIDAQITVSSTVNVGSTFALHLWRGKRTPQSPN